MRRRCASASALLLVPGLAGFVHAHGPDVLGYEVDLVVDRSARQIEATERIHVRAEAGPLSALVFPRNGIAVSDVRVAGAPAQHWLTADTVEIALPRPLASGARATVALAYRVRSPRGVTFAADHVYTAFFACHWMVCREDPADRATLTLTVTTPAAERVIAAGHPGPVRRLSDGRVQHVWRERHPYPSYLFAFALGAFTRTTTRQGPTTLEVHAVDLDPAARARAFADTGRMLDFFRAKAGVPLPHTHYRQVVVAGGEAQEATSLSLIGRTHVDALLAAPDDDWVVAHELAHQFWGNLVTCADWPDFWLNEGLTVFMVAAWKEHRFGRAAYDRELALARARYQTAVEAGLDVPLTFVGRYPSLRLRRAIVYSKAALFLAALRETMGEAAFWTALRTYTRRYAGRAVQSADFARIFAAASRRDLAPLFAAWVFPPG